MRLRIGLRRRKNPVKKKLTSKDLQVYKSTTTTTTTATTATTATGNFFFRSTIEAIESGKKNSTNETFELMTESNNRL
ncbi:hypothetical protein DERF_010336 [Dermatophagoides farinae]|uniref:Uncharacterized protein n=1 Tax=Dermatophagoides farinae TaxID=6954 RepID=A0A922L6S7_DERFA|nr:hypothetical protein DERF_010336 [Dermatophagoides farinae]